MNRCSLVAAATRLTIAANFRQLAGKRAFFGGAAKQPDNFGPLTGRIARLSSASSDGRSANIGRLHLESHPPSWPRGTLPPDPFELLGLAKKDPTVQELRQAYAKLVKQLHPDLAVSPPKLTIDDARWAYDAAIAALETPQAWRRQECWRKGDSFKEQPNHRDSEQPTMPDKRESYRATRLQRWRLRQSEAAAFWNERHRDENSEGVTDGRGPEEKTLFCGLFQRRLREEDRSFSKQGCDSLGSSSVVEQRVAARRKQGLSTQPPQAKQWNTNDFARIQHQELEELGLSTRVVEELGLVRHKQTDDTPVSNLNETKPAASASRGSSLFRTGDHLCKNEKRGGQDRISNASGNQVFFPAVAGAVVLAVSCFSLFAATPT
ncbi:DnaJ domain-containing protein [Toxoplasma gondii GT1]|uniref:DnaJ domain-containing protein n=2 Tax=Toxoplasma gondii TaxID=5811 RepID=S7VZ73_TOXGG|nr:DnaJ domain-containing protein [Toxoplasma gondii GT1]KAF4640092.1 DnaJ domain-containing protein [Toxoplasma gondii]